MSKIDDKSVFDPKIESLIQQKIDRINAFNFRWDKIQVDNEARDLIKELKELATIESVGSSTRIEGVTLTDAEVKDLIDNLDISNLETRDEEEVVGYYEALDLVFDSHDSIMLTEAYIKQLHSLLLKHSSKDTRHKGDYKSLSNKVVAKYPGGVSKIVFNTTEPFLVAKEMSELVEWTNAKLKGSSMHSLIVVAVFVYEFLSIHPFQDGNGRLSRLLTNLLLMRMDYQFVQCISLEHIIEERKKDYYHTLMDGQKDRYSEDENISLWVIYFLECIEVLIERLEHKFESLKMTKPSIGINDRQEKILELIKESDSIRMSQLMKALPEVPRPTMSYDLSSLVDKGLIVKLGRGRGTFYKLPN